MSTIDDRPTTGYGLTAEQVELLLRMIAEGRVRQQKGNDHLEAWDIRRWLNRIFGFTGWSEECLDETLVHERIWPAKEEDKFRCTAVYRVRLRLHIRDVWGNELKFSDGAAAGESVNQPSIGDAHDMALKTAYSQALKRCAIDLGDQFGLSLYNKARRQDNKAVVQQTLGHPFAPKASDWNAEVPEDAPVTSGELDEQPEAAAEPVQQPAQQRPNGVQRSRPAEPAGEWTDEEPAVQPQRAGEQPASRPQLNMLNAVLSKKRGNLSRPERLGAVAKLAGRALASSADLTKREASRVIDKLNDEPDFVGAAPQEQSVPQGLEAELLARVGAVRDMEQLDEVWSAVQDNAHLGALTPEQEQGLTAAMNRREAELKQPVGASA